ncbi:MAG: hypothetical protein IJF29_06460 [Firmicutes bacterium]|nr:hypothetical protein [Bacillota bacterium]
MNLIRNNIKELMEKCKYKWINENIDDIDDELLTILFNCFYFFENYEDEICTITGATKEVFHYSLVYWASAFARRYEYLGGTADGFLTPSQIWVFERLERNVKNPDWDYVAMIVEGKV